MRRFEIELSIRQVTSSLSFKAADTRACDLLLSTDLDCRSLAGLVIADKSCVQAGPH
jgi:hypothetical protein